MSPVSFTPVQRSENPPEIIASAILIASGGLKELQPILKRLSISTHVPDPNWFDDPRLNCKMPLLMRLRKHLAWNRGVSLFPAL